MLLTTTEILQYFALERFLYRLGQSSYAQNFVLKGALMLTAWQGPSVRSTRDVDLLGHLSNSVDRVVEAIKAISTVMPKRFSSRSATTTLRPRNGMALCPLCHWICDDEGLLGCQPSMQCREAWAGSCELF